MKINLIFDALINKSHFPKVKSVDLELKKNSIIRIFIGLIILVRFGEIIYTDYFFNSSISLLSISVLLSILLLIIGIGVPLLSVLLIFLIRIFDAEMGTNTLGTSILIEVLLILFLSGSGQYYSLDRLILQQKNFFSKFIKQTYSFIGYHSKNSLTQVYFFIFLIYAIISLGALSYHLNDPYWIEALTIKSLFSNSYLCSNFQTFRFLENNLPIATSIFSIIGTILQSLFQFLMIPLIFTKIGSYFVKWWGMNFFILSLFFINLSYLPHIEILLWLMLFFPASPKSKKVKILYDDYCNLCKKTMLLFKAINFNERYQFLALSKHRSLYEEHDLSEKEVKTYMVGWYNQKIYKGYDLYLKLLLVNPLMWVFLPVFYIGKITKIGSILYDFIAERRYRLFGQCEISFEDKIQKLASPFKPSLRQNRLNFFYLAYGILLLFFVLLKFPIVNKLSSKLAPHSTIKSVNHFLYRSGLEIPNVFNVTDLSMGDHWMVISQLDKEGKAIKSLNFSGKYGERLNNLGIDLFHFSNHNSDALYFGTSLPYRRGILYTTDKIVYHLKPESKGYMNIKKRLLYHYNYHKLNGMIPFEIKVFQSQSSKVIHWKPKPERHDRELLLHAIFLFDGKEITKITKLS